MKREKLDILFVSESPLWPLDQGYRVHGYHMAQALQRAGLRVGMTSMRSTVPEQMPLPLRAMHCEWPAATSTHVSAFHARWSGPLGKLRHRVADHQGLSVAEMAGIVALAEHHQPELVIGLGLHSPLMLRGLDKSIKRIWYAADEPVYFHLSCLRRLNWRSRPLAEVAYRARAMVVYGLIEQLFVRDLDGAIGVSPTDTRLLRLIGGARRAVTIRNGVDLEYFAPARDAQVEPSSLIFWGRMDFEPNIDAVCWFARHVWPQLKRQNPDATWKIVGKHPSPRVQALGGVEGIEVTGEVADVRPFAHQVAVTILPMRCGGGIKNKLLEAAAMGLPVVASPRAVRGLAFDEGIGPALVCKNAQAWAEAIRRLWQDTAETARLRTAARQWAQRHHAWSDAAMLLIAWVQSIGGKIENHAVADETSQAIMPKSQAA